jgi:hypothetical protein
MTSPTPQAERVLGLALYMSLHAIPASLVLIAAAWYTGTLTAQRHSTPDALSLSPAPVLHWPLGPHKTVARPPPPARRRGGWRTGAVGGLGAAGVRRGAAGGVDRSHPLAGLGPRDGAQV